MRRIALLAVCAACRTPDAPAGCTAALSGNLTESIARASVCPTLERGAGASNGDTLLQFKIASQTLGGDFAIRIDLGKSPTPGAYNSGTTELWSAAGLRHVAPHGACVLDASNNSTPNGDFVLELTSIDRTASPFGDAARRGQAPSIDHATAHGTLKLRMFVLPRVADDGTRTDCGAGTTEQLDVRF